MKNAKTLIQEFEKKFGGMRINDSLKHQILPFMDEYLKIAEPNTAVVLKEILDTFGKGGGVGYSSKVIVFYKNQRKSKKWQWRDHYDMEDDRPELRVDDLRIVKVSDKNKKGIVYIELELENANYTRTTTFEFDQDAPDNY